MLPLRRQITEQTQLEFNAMQIGGFQLLQAKREEIETGAAYIEALREYWIARAMLEQTISGRSPDAGSTGMTSPTTHSGSTTGAAQGGH